ncbi:ATP-binding cassette domain-containing protein [Actinocrispum wychmicini]|uniref:ATP-binding cassette domain-containing protein n=1 Tax=Actinocrispum wychmicini TaxID=1213861 RepID=UPI0024427F36|nr:ATP-binding cassette domain-containing protein [Actinocrispum wychmicini]
MIPAGRPRIVTIAGESGSGKSTLAAAVLGLLPLTEGTVTFKGHDIARLSRADRKQFRRQVQAVFQDPYGTFNPYYRVSHTFDTVLRNFRLAKGSAARSELVEEALAVVSLSGEEVLHKVSPSAQRRAAAADHDGPRLPTQTGTDRRRRASLHGRRLAPLDDLADHANNA